MTDGASLFHTLLSSVAAIVAGAAARGVVVFAVAVLALRCTRSMSAARRSLIITGAFAAQFTLLLLGPLPAAMKWRILPSLAERDGAPMVASPIALPTAGDHRLGTVDAVGEPVEPRKGADVVALLALIWIAGSVSLLVLRAQGMLRLRRILARCAPADVPHALAGRSTFTADGAPFHRTLVAADESGPFACGILRPAIVLPASSREWSRDRLRAVLLHERAHVGRHDALTKLLSDITLALVWPNPFAWLVHRAGEFERERACDDAAVESGLNPSAYVLEIVAVARLRLSHANDLFPASGFFGRAQFARRMETLLSAGASRKPATRRRVVVTLATFVVFAFGLATIGARPLDASGEGRVSSFSGCDWDGVRHLNRTRAVGNGRLVWNVEWSGDQCGVTFTATGNIASSRGWSAFLNRGPADTARFVVRRNGLIYRELLVAPGSERPDGLNEALVELDRHTAFALDRRFPLILAQGTDSVFAEIERMQGDHSAGEYLHRLVEAVPLSDFQIGRILSLTQSRVSNTYELHRLLLSLASKPAMASPALRAWGLRVAASISNDASRAEVVDAFEAAGLR